MNELNAREKIILIVLTIVGLALGILISFELTREWTREIIVILRITIICFAAVFGGAAGLGVGIVICAFLNELL